MVSVEAPCWRLAGLLVGDERAGDALHVDAVVLVEPWSSAATIACCMIWATSASGTSRRFSSYIVASSVLPSEA